MRKQEKGGMRITLPKVGVGLTMARGFVSFTCPSCHTILYRGQGNPHKVSTRMIERHVPACKLLHEDPTEATVGLGD